MFHFYLCHISNQLAKSFKFISEMTIMKKMKQSKKNQTKNEIRENISKMKTSHNIVEKKSDFLPPSLYYLLLLYSFS